MAFETFNAQNREPQFLADVLAWFEQLRTANQRLQVYEENALHRFLKERLFIVLTTNTIHWRQVWKTYHQEKLYRYIPTFWTTKFVIKILRAMLIKK